MFIETETTGLEGVVHMAPLTFAIDPEKEKLEVVLNAAKCMFLSVQTFLLQDTKTLKM